MSRSFSSLRAISSGLPYSALLARRARVGECHDAGCVVAVRSLRDCVQPALPGEASIQRCLFLRIVARHIEGSRDANLRRIESESVRLHCLAIQREPLADFVERRELVE
jgi:hypothetical protein